jgi:tetratricopeptide repeat protein 8
MSDIKDAYFYFRRQEKDKCLELVNKLLEQVPFNEQLLLLKIMCLSSKAFVRESDQESSIADIWLQQNSIVKSGTARIRTAKPKDNQSRPITQSGRQITGFARPGTAAQNVQVGNNRLTTSYTRQQTAIKQSAQEFITENTLSRIDVKKYSAVPGISKGLFFFLLYSNNVDKALELASLCSTKSKNWFWKTAMAKCFYRKSLFKDAERLYKSSLKDMDLVETYLALGSIYSKMGQPLNALSIFKKGLEKFQHSNVSLINAIGRIYEEPGNLQSFSESTRFYKLSLNYDAANIEALSSLAGNYFYSSQPENALKL